MANAAEAILKAPPPGDQGLRSAATNFATTVAGEPPQVLADASNFILVSSLACLVFVLSSALVTYWKEENRRSWKAIAFAIPLLFFGGTALARFVYVKFCVLG